MYDSAVVEEIKYRNDLQDVVSAYVTLKRAGSGLVGLCPFHSEKTPSFHVVPEKGFFHCFGCGAGGDVISFIMRMENLEYPLSLIHICVIGDSCPEYMTVYISAVTGGGVIVPLDKDLADDEIVNFLNLSGAEAVFYTESFNNRLASYSDRLPKIKYFVPIAEKTEASECGKILPYSKVIETGKKALQDGNRSYLDFDCKKDMNKMSALLFTSGTTGTSKGVMLTHANLVASTNASCQDTVFTEVNTFVDVLPMHHSYELTCSHLAACLLYTSPAANI